MACAHWVVRIGERYDEDVALQYVNARYYDPALGMFMQPNWVAVTETGVGTNRYAYNLNDPASLSDPEANQITDLDKYGRATFALTPKQAIHIRERHARNGKSI